MTSNKIMKKLIPAMIASAAALVMALPISANAAGGRGRGAGVGFRSNVVVNRGQPMHPTFAHPTFARPSAPMVPVRHDTWNRDWDHDGWRDWDRREDRDEWRERAYVPAAPVYAVPEPVYSTPYYGGYGAGPCVNASRLQGVYRHDLRTGHPAAANDVARQMRVAENRCYGNSGYGYNNYAYGNSVFDSPILGNLFGGW